MVTVRRCLCWRLGKKKSTSVLLSRYVCSYIKTNGLFQHQIGTTEWFDLFFCFATVFLTFFLYKVPLSDFFVKEILVSMKATYFFSQKVLFASFLTRYGKLLCCKCFVRVLCNEYHVIK